MGHGSRGAVSSVDPTEGSATNALHIRQPVRVHFAGLTVGTISGYRELRMVQRHQHLKVVDPLGKLEPTLDVS